jgi:hypothetical protein
MKGKETRCRKVGLPTGDVTVDAAACTGLPTTYVYRTIDGRRIRENPAKSGTARDRGSDVYSTLVLQATGAR